MTSNPNAADQVAAPAQSRHGGTTIILHWLTALLVIALFATANIWGFLERGSSLRHGLQSFHISMGLLLAAVMVLRLVWRVTRKHDLTRTLPKWQEAAASLVHVVLYALLVGQVALGFLLRWAQGEPLTFFGLFSMPTLVTLDDGLARTLGGLHDNVAWAIMIIAGLHAGAALLHHYVLRDDVLLRMMPAKG